MKIRVLILFVTAALLAFTSVYPQLIQANSQLDKLTQELKELEKQLKTKASEQKKVEEEIKRVKKNQQALQREKMSIDLRIEETNRKLIELQGEIDQTVVAAQQAAVELDEAILRVEERDKLLKQRVRAMYETGDVSYLELLLDSTSIGDFLSRLDYVQRVVDADVRILEENKRDQALIEEKKAEIEAFLVELDKKYDELYVLKQQDEENNRKLSASIASLQEQEKELEEFDEQLQEQLKNIAIEHAKKRKEAEKVYYSGGKLHWPVPDSTRITSKFGYRIHPISKTRKLHSGIDIGAPAGTDIVAAEAGEVILAEYYGGFGNTVMISHGGGLVTLYAHIRHNGIKVKMGQVVERGEKIAEVGSTGTSTGNHLHFSVLKDGEYVEPMNYFGK